MGLLKKAEIKAIDAAIDYVYKDPVNNISKVIDVVQKFDRTNHYEGAFNYVREIFQDPNGTWPTFARKIVEECDEGVVKTFFKNFFINSAFIGVPLQKEMGDKYGISVPWAILMDPTTACNLHCTGCWAAEYGHKLNLTFEKMEDIVRQGNELGVYMFLFSGGEPLVRKKDVIKLCENHPDCIFLSFTNGTLIDEEFADEMLRVKNFVPALSIEGFEEATDFRRGKGTYQRVVNAMNILKRKGLIFGTSCCYTSKNVDVIGSEEFYDQLIEWGARFSWFLTYLPVGNDAVPELMVKPEQRKFMYNQIHQFRREKPLFALDFWNDGEYVHGCIAAGRNGGYLHINSNGDVEGCAFMHYADRNINECSLIEALGSPFFQAYRSGQPFNDNPLRPCPLLDNPEGLRKAVHTGGAHSTDMESPEEIDHLTAKCDDAAAAWAVVADEIWANHPKNPKNKERVEALAAK